MLHLQPCGPGFKRKVFALLKIFLLRIFLLNILILCICCSKNKNKCLDCFLKSWWNGTSPSNLRKDSDLTSFCFCFHLILISVEHEWLHLTRIMKYPSVLRANTREGRGEREGRGQTVRAGRAGQVLWLISSRDSLPLLKSSLLLSGLEHPGDQEE